MAEGTHEHRRGLRERLGERVVRLLRVPPPPAAPAGSHGSLRRLRPARGFYRYLLLRWGLQQAGTLFGLVAGLTFLGRVPGVPHPGLIQAAELLGAAGFVLQLPFTLYLVHLEYDFRWYLVTDRSLRIREGILAVREQTLSFANVQNVSIQQGPVQRLFGISDLRVRTAGGGRAEQQGGGEGKPRDLHLGYLRGLGGPEAVRDLIVGHVRRLRDSGLGDPDDAREGPRSEEDASGHAAGPGDGPGADPALEAARRLLAEARGLRSVLRS